MKVWYYRVKKLRQHLTLLLCFVDLFTSYKNFQCAAFILNDLKCQIYMGNVKRAQPNFYNTKCNQASSYPNFPEELSFLGVFFLLSLFPFSFLRESLSGNFVVLRNLFMLKTFLLPSSALHRFNIKLYITEILVPRLYCFNGIDK